MKTRVPWNGVNDPSKTVINEAMRSISPNTASRKIKSKAESRNTQFNRKHTVSKNENDIN